MSVEATHQDDAAIQLDAMAEQAEREDQQAQAKAEQAEAEQDGETGEWEDGAAQEDAARHMAQLGVRGVEIAANLIYPGTGLDANSRANGEEALLPVARDFSGELPEWLQPYVHYIHAGMWVGGVLVGTYMAKRRADAEEARQAEAERQAAQGAGDGV